MELPADPEGSFKLWRELLEQNHMSPDMDTRKIGLQFSASGQHKTWPENRFSELGARLLSCSEKNIVCLMGGPGDKRAALRIKESMGKKSGHPGRILELAGKIKLSRFPELVKGLDLLITNDTGPLHAAIAVHTPTISLFVASNHGETGPVQDLAIHRIITKEKPCLPCLEKYCKDPSCMDLITVDEVFEAAVRALDSKYQQNP